MWTSVAIDADSRVAVAYRVDRRNASAAREFVLDVADRVLTGVQLTTDGHRTYLDAVENAFGAEADFAQLVKLYGPDGSKNGCERKYSPGECNGSKSVAQIGVPARQHVSTSCVERQNLTMGMSMRRFMTNAFGKKAENLVYAVALRFFYHNFCRKHQTFGETPAQAGGLAHHRWSIEGLLGLLC